MTNQKRVRNKVLEKAIVTNQRNKAYASSLTANQTPTPTPDSTSADVRKQQTTLVRNQRLGSTPEGSLTIISTDPQSVVAFLGGKASVENPSELERMVVV